MAQSYQDFLKAEGIGQSTAQILNAFFDAVIESIQEDALSKDQKIPLTSFHYITSETGGELYVASYFKYLVKGRRPGKQPPPDQMLKFVQGHPDMLESAKRQFKNITEKGLAFIIGRKIAKRGTDIYTGKRQGIDFAGAVDDNLKILLEALTMNEVAKIKQQLKAIIK